MHACASEPAEPPRTRGRLLVTQQAWAPAISVRALCWDSHESFACLLICVNQTTCEESSSERGFASSLASSAGDTRQGQPRRASPLLVLVVWAAGLGGFRPGPLPPIPPPPPSRAGRAGDRRSGNWGSVSASLSSPGRSGVYRAGRAALPLLSPNHFRTRPFGKSPCKKDLIEKGCHCSLPPAQPRGAVERAVREQGEAGGATLGHCAGWRQL